jgi:hypothetical protein
MWCGVQTLAWTPHVHIGFLWPRSDVLQLRVRGVGCRGWSISQVSEAIAACGVSCVFVSSQTSRAPLRVGSGLARRVSGFCAPGLSLSCPGGVFEG